MSSSRECLAEEQLLAYLHHSLSDDEARLAEAHLAQCNSCRQLFQEMTKHLLREFDIESDPVAPANTAHSGGDTPTALSPLESELPADLEPAATPQYLGRLKGYDILRVLGRGGYGIVFEALDSMLKRKVAIKVLTRDLASRPAARRRFIREARAGAAINHPNVVTIHGVDETGATPFIVMELVPGKTLRDRIRSQSKLDVLDVLRIAAQTAQGLAAAHAQGIIHRDVKPGNIMLVDDVPRVKLTDFGLARAMTADLDWSSRGQAAGTPAYMSPEQVRGDDLDGRSDLFALGCVIYAMFTGHSPFSGSNTLEIARRIVEETPPDLAVACPGAPGFLSDLVKRLLEKDRDKRYQSAAEVADVLNRHLTLLNQTPTDRLPEALNQPLLKPAVQTKRWPLVGGAVLCAILLLIAGEWSLSRLRSASGGALGDAGPPTSTVGRATTTETPDAAGAESLPTRTEVTVSKAAGEGDFTLINVALRNVAPGGTVTILDDAEYAESLLLDQPDRFAGVKIMSSRRATLNAPHGVPPVVIQGVPQVHLIGLRLIVPQHVFGIDVGGECPGLTLDNLELERVAEAGNVSASVAAVVLRNSAAGTAEAPIVVRQVQIHNTRVGIVVGNGQTSSPPPRQILIEECTVVGTERASATLVALVRASQDVTIRRSTFSRGVRGVSVLCEAAEAPQRCTISHNTWHDLGSWFAWSGELPQPPELSITNNLIASCSQESPSAMRLAKVPSASPVFQHNLAVSFFESERQGFSALAEVGGEITFLSEDPRHADFLRPSAVKTPSGEPYSGAIPGRHATAD